MGGLGVTTFWCPGCEVRDPTTEVVDVSWCGTHEPPRAGCDDSLLENENGAMGVLFQEPGGDSNRAWCDFVHRKER